MTLNRRQFITTAVLGSAATLFPVPRLFARREDPFTVLRRNVGTFTGQGGTIGWLINDDVIVVVDTQFPDSAVQCWEGLQKRSDKPLDLIVNTHHHGDHTAGNATFKAHGKRILGHKNVPNLLAEAAKTRDDMKGIPAPDVTYSDTWEENVGDERLRLKYYGPAHTSGDSVVFFEKANVVHMGDLVFNRLPPYIDLPGGASTANWITLLEAVHKDFRDDTIFIYGHANKNFKPTGNRADLLVMRDFLTGLREHVDRGIKAGKSKDEITGIEKLPAFPDHYQEGFIPLKMVLEIVHTEMAPR